ncbi:hypothetical protein [Candidatus Liberibacter brunswickensis]
MNIKKIGIILTVAISTILISGCSKSNTNKKPKKKNTSQARKGILYRLK